jgi:hypothetical protein
MWALSTTEILSTRAILAKPRPCAQAAAARRLPLTTHQFVVRAHFRQRFPVNDGPRADRQGGEGLSTASPRGGANSPAVASGAAAPR